MVTIRHKYKNFMTLEKNRKKSCFCHQAEVTGIIRLEMIKG